MEKIPVDHILIRINPLEAILLTDELDVILSRYDEVLKHDEMSDVDRTVLKFRMDMLNRLADKISNLRILETAYNSAFDKDNEDQVVVNYPELPSKSILTEMEDKELYSIQEIRQLGLYNPKHWIIKGIKFFTSMSERQIIQYIVKRHTKTYAEFIETLGQGYGNVSKREPEQDTYIPSEDDFVTFNTHTGVNKTDIWNMIVENDITNQYELVKHLNNL